MTQIPRTPALQRLRDMLKRAILSWFKDSGSTASAPHRLSKWKHTAKIPPPPVPPRMREMLKDYPEMIKEVQRDLEHIVSVMEGRSNATPPFERAVWTLQDALGHLYGLAEKEVQIAEAGGNPETIEKARHKRLRIGRTRSERPWDDEGDESLWDYFQSYRAAFE